MNRLRGGLGVLAFSAVVGLVMPLVGHAASRQLTDQSYRDLELLTDALSIVQSDYVEEPESKTLIYGALRGMLQALDPYSQFMDPDMYQEIRVETEGEFGGLGIEISIRDSLLTIISPIDGTPAYEAGLKPGDRIVKINNELTRDMTLSDAVKQLRGKPNTSVILTILREGESRLLDIEVMRAIIKIESIREARILSDDIGYVRIAEFQEKTSRDLRAALEMLREEGMTALILDLRNNPGGLLDASVSVAEQFLPARALVVSTAGRVRDQNIEFRARGGAHEPDYPMIILVNEGSASASEIVAGAMQDHHRGIVMGMKTFGKGSVQTVIPLKDGSALRLTTSRYYTPSGRSIHGEGIVPDVVVELVEVPASEESQQERIFRQLENGAEEVNPDNAEGRPKTLDAQLARAVDLLKGIRVYEEILRN